MRRASSRSGFTIVELLIVIVVIAVLAAITVVAYNGITNRAHVATGTSHLKELVKKAELFRVESGQLPGSILDVKGAKYEDSYVYGGDKYCLSTTVNDNPYHMLSTNQSLQPGYCGNIKPDYPVAAESCFGFDAGLGSVSHYWDYQGGNSNTSNPRCPERFTIPSTIGGVAVTDVSIYGFQNDIRGVVIPEGVVTVGGEDTAFYEVPSIDFIYIPDTVVSIGSGLFGTSLRSLYIPDSVSSIHFTAFNGNPNLKSVHVGSEAYAGPANLTLASSFSGNVELEHVYLGGIVNTVTNGAFGGSSKLRDLRLSSGLTTISNAPFSGSKIESLTIPGTVSSISGGAFSGLSLLKNLVFEDSNINLTINQGSFSAISINNLIIPGRVKVITEGAFGGIAPLTNVTFRPGITTIGGGTFSGTGITAVSIPNGATVDSNAFPPGTTITYY